MEPLAFTVFGTPQPAGSKRAFVIQGKARVTDANAKSKPWKNDVAQVAGLAMAEYRARHLSEPHALLDGPLAVSMTFYRARPKGHNGKNGLNATGRETPYPIVKPDTLKLARGVEDAMTGVVYRDDAQIVWELLQKEYGTPERCEVIVELIES